MAASTEPLPQQPLANVRKSADTNERINEKCGGLEGGGFVAGMEESPERVAGWFFGVNGGSAGAGIHLDPGDLFAHGPTLPGTLCSSYGVTACRTCEALPRWSRTGPAVRQHGRAPPNEGRAPFCAVVA